MVSRDQYGHPISINYRGSDSYQTKLGALCTLATQILILIYTINLVIGFRNNSLQEEKTQTTTVDLFDTDDYNFKEYHTGMVILVWPPIPPQIGYIKA